MASLDVGLQAALQVSERSSLGRRRKESRVEFLESVTSDAPYSNRVAVVVPLDGGAGRESQLVPNLRGYGDLTLSGEARLCEAHETYITSVMALDQNRNRTKGALCCINVGPGLRRGGRFNACSGRAYPSDGKGTA